MEDKTTASNNVNEEMLIPSSQMVGLEINEGLQIKEIQFFCLKLGETLPEIRNDTNIYSCFVFFLITFMHHDLEFYF